MVYYKKEIKNKKICMQIILIIIFFLILLFLIFIYILKNKINKLEKILNLEFKKRDNKVPFLYSVSKENINKSNEVFENIFSLRKQEFSNNSFEIEFIKKIKVYEKIHREINFIFKVCEKHEKLNKNEKYNYIKDSILEKSSEIGMYFELYKKLIEKYNQLIILSKFIIIGYIFGLEKKEIS